jgi:hypothetical protein
MKRSSLTELEERVRSNTALTEAHKAELLGLLSSLGPRLDDLSATKREHAESIAGFLERSTSEAMRTEKDPALLSLALRGLSASVKSLEESHPDLVREVDYICTTLANMGI